MSRIPNITHEGAAAMTYLAFLSKALIDKGHFKSWEILDLINKSAERHEEAAKVTTSHANADAAQTLREFAAEISELFPG